MYNKVILIGNTTRDVEVRYSPGGTPIATISLAVNSKYKKGDAMVEEVLFINAVVFGKQAESCGQYLSKGNPVLIEGRLRENKWEKDGEKKSRMEVIANNIRFLPKRDSQRRGEGSTGQGGEDEAPTEVAEVTDIEPF